MPDLNDIAALAAKYVNTTDRHIFLTGKAGTGKTTFLKYIVNHTYKNTAVAAPTGIAAINAGGVTLHSLLQLPFGLFVPENIPLSDTNIKINTPRTLFKDFRVNAVKRQLIQGLELLIIDEVSMLRADLLDCMDHILRYLRQRKKEPFGGLQILFIGDLMQLPPVVRDEDRVILERYYPSAYFFEAHALKSNPPIKVELQTIYRQTDEQFVSILNRLRNNQQTQEDSIFLNGYYQPNIENESPEGYIHLTTHNYKADQINNSRLEKLKDKLYTFKAVISGEFPENMYPTVELLELKVGVQVMFIKNDPSGEGQYFNGKIGKISDLESSKIKVRFENGDEVGVEHYEWENKRYALNQSTKEVDEVYLGKFSQFPIKLAWAVTVHKSQGLTFEKAILDLSGTFAPGQLYVALSRLTSLNGLILSSRLPENPPGVDNSLSQYSASYNREEELIAMLDQDRKNYLVKFAEQTFGFGSLLQTLHYHVTGFDKDENRSIKQQYLSWTNELVAETRSLNEVGLKFVIQIKTIVSQENYFGSLNERLCKAWEYFNAKVTAIKNRIADHKKSLQKEKRVTTYLKELKEIEGKYQYQLSQMHKLMMLVKLAAENKVLSKKSLKDSTEYVPLQIDNSKVKKDKTPTAEISYALFKEGKTIKEIALERGLVEGTILGHLCQYVSLGEIVPEQLIDTKKIDQIKKQYEKGVEGFGELKAALGDHISYNDIKVVLAYFELEKTKVGAS